MARHHVRYRHLMSTWRERFEGRFLDITYEDTVSDLEPNARALLDFLELPWEDACLTFYETDRPVRTASSEQVRRPIYKDSIGFWRHYESQLGELIEVLEPVLPRYRALLP